MEQVKRGLNKTEAMDYHGVKLKFFNLHVMPLLKDRAVKAGISLIFQRKDLDDAWERYTLTADGNRALDTPKREKVWHEQNSPVSASKKTARTGSTLGTENSAFLSVVSGLTSKPRTGLSSQNRPSQVLRISNVPGDARPGGSEIYRGEGGERSADAQKRYFDAQACNRSIRLFNFG